MIYIKKTGSITLTLNVNNNTRDDVSTYLLNFTHIMSNDNKQYTIDTTNPYQFGKNDRYCEMVFTGTFYYEGEYKLQIYANGTDKVYDGIVIVGEQTEEFIKYVSDNEENNNYIYLD